MIPRRDRINSHLTVSKVGLQAMLRILPSPLLKSLCFLKTKNVALQKILGVQSLV